MATTTLTSRKRARSPHQPTGQWIRTERRLAIYLRDGWTCMICGEDLLHATPREITLEHHVGRADGGGNGEGNLHVACRPCNDARRKPVGGTLRRVRSHLGRDLAPYLRLAKILVRFRALGECDEDRVRF